MVSCAGSRRAVPGVQKRVFQQVYIKYLCLEFYFSQKYCLSSEIKVLGLENSMKIKDFHRILNYYDLYLRAQTIFLTKIQF